MSGRVPRLAALAAAIVLACLLLAATYTVMAGPQPSPVLQPATGEGHSVTSAVGPLSWSSGWVAIYTTFGRTFSHNLGQSPENYVVDLLFRDTDGDLGIHRRFYGGADDGSSGMGAFWHHLDANSVIVSRVPGDTVAEEALVRVWVQPTPPDYDSGWTPIEAGQTITFAHGLGQTPTDLSVGLWFSATASLIHHMYYGGHVMDTEPPYARGGYWHNLTENTVQVTRQQHDNTMKAVRVVVNSETTPAYDSLVDRGGWQNIAQGALVTFTHNLGVSPELQVVRGECLSPDPALGIHTKFAGGEHDPTLPGWVGSNIQNLTANSVTVYRQPQDTVCPQVRVVVYTLGSAFRLYLPLVLKAHSLN